MLRLFEQRIERNKSDGDSQGDDSGGFGQFGATEYARIAQHAKDDDRRHNECADHVSQPPGKPDIGKIGPLRITRNYQSGDSHSRADRGRQHDANDGEFCHRIGSRKCIASVGPDVDHGRADQRFKRVAGCNRNRGADRAGGGSIGDHRAEEYCWPGSISPQHDRSEGKTGRGPNGRGTGINQGEGETALGEDEIGQPDSDQASNIVQSSAEGCPRGNRMWIRNC